MRTILTALFFLLFSANVFSFEPKNCTEPNEHMKMYFGTVEDMVLGNVVDFKSMLKRILISHAEEVERVANLSPSYAGPDSEYIPRLIELLERPAGGKHETDCLWRLYKDGDTLVEFEDNGAMVFREGYALLRNGAVIGYFYSSIAVV